MHELDVVEHLVATAPRLVPVKTNAPYILGRFGVGEDGAGSLVDEVTVMIPGNDLLVTQPFSLHSRAEVVLQEVSLVFRGVDARLPCLRRHGLVLNADAPDGYSFPLV